MHAIFFFERPITVEQYDSFVSAEMPDADRHPVLHDFVRAHMLHRCDRRRCRRGSRPPAPAPCEKRFPHAPADVTTHPAGARYASYRRRHGEPDAYVVPYNPPLLVRYNCHLNVEITSVLSTVKYLYAYIFKGFDLTEAQQRALDASPHDEIEEYIQHRYLGPSEAMWRIFKFPLYGLSHTVVVLSYHTPGNRTVVHDGTTQGAAAAVASAQGTRASMLEAYFARVRLERRHPLSAQALQRGPPARDLCYPDMPYYYRWNSGNTTWTRRQARAVRVVSRVHYQQPTSRLSARYFLRMLLFRVRGAESFEELRSVDGFVHETFQAACAARGLLHNDAHFHQSMEDAAGHRMPAALRGLFATIVGQNCCSLRSVSGLWDAFKAVMSEDFALILTGQGQRGVPHLPPHHAEDFALLDVRQRLQRAGHNPDDCGVPHVPLALREFVIPRLDTGAHRRENGDGDNVPRRPSPEERLRTFHATANGEQRALFMEIDGAVQRAGPHSDDAPCFFINACAGTGKTRVARALLAAARARRQVAIAAASTGLAAAMFEHGATAHRTFAIPVNAHGDGVLTSYLHLDSPAAGRLRRAALIVVDEAVMLRRHALDCAHNLLRRLHGYSAECIPVQMA